MGNLINKTSVYELYENGILIATISGDKKFEKYYNDYKNELYNKGYRFLKGASPYEILVNYKVQQCAFLAHRHWFGFRDVDGNKIYDGDRLTAGGGWNASINQYYNKKNEYYLRLFADNCPNVKDTPISTNWDFIKIYNIKVVDSVFNHFYKG